MNRRHWFRRLFPTSRRLLVERSIRHIQRFNYDTVLVIGAGCDPYRGIFLNAKRYIRLDIKQVESITDILGDAMALPFVACSFDCVFASEVLEHVSDPFCFMKEVRRVLKPGGTIIVTVPFLFHQHGDPYDYWRPTNDSLKFLFDGFREVEVTRQGNRIHVISDIVTTSFYPIPLLFPLRILNHLLVRIPGLSANGGSRSTAPSGFLVMARK